MSATAATGALSYAAATTGLDASAASPESAGLDDDGALPLLGNGAFICVLHPVQAGG
jgi:hypothetical protein